MPPHMTPGLHDNMLIHPFILHPYQYANALLKYRMFSNVLTMFLIYH